MAKRPFLTAMWRYLLMLNFEIDPDVLWPFLPAGTELDTWNGRHYVSLVAFLFQNTRVWGVSIPFHRHFEEINLRFYVRRRTNEGERRGVVFVREIVPRWAIATVARLAYNENYIAMPTRHHLEKGKNGLAVAYEWRFQGNWQQVAAQAQGEPKPLVAGSEAEFIAEHYWGYSRGRNGRTIEYQVTHPAWRIWSVTDFTFTCDVAALYGPQFLPAFSTPPLSVFLAEGSAVAVYPGRPLPGQKENT
ncbi:MAG: DUF2071 domain-containing protein [Chloroflexi bacterium]|nr:MAG: DUF2071 domain-containing protein [Chloroflexota bacterium]